MGHLCSLAHPFSLSCRVDYCLNWPEPLPSPSFHFSCADIYWSLSEKYPSGHPFPKVELQRKSSWRGCLYVRVIYKWAERAFIFLRFFSLPVTVSVPLACSLNLNLFALFICPSQLLFYNHPYFCLLVTLNHPFPLFTALLFPPRDAVQPFEPVFQFGV